MPKNLKSVTGDALAVSIVTRNLCLTSTARVLSWELGRLVCSRSWELNRSVCSMS